jgi:alcohol dehydrogenase class IV
MAQGCAAYTGLGGLMAVSFSFATAGRILFGPGTVNHVADLAAPMARHVLLVTGATPARADGLAADLVRAGLQMARFAVDREPDVAGVTAGAQLARAKGCDMVIGFGGGSVMDAAKAIAALITNPGPVTDYLEVIGKAMPLESQPVPCIAIPTTAGTGSEVTRNAVIRSAPHRVKVSMRSPDMLPDLAVVDPELTLELPPEGTAASGFDALCQLLEAYVSARANPLTDSLCREGLRRCARSLKTVVEDGRQLEARADMALASLFSGLALANAGLGAVHGIAAPLGGMHPAPHGAICARLLPGITAANIQALSGSATHAHYGNRYREVAVLLTGDPHSTAPMLVHWLEAMTRTLKIPGLARWGLKEDEIAPLAHHALHSSSMKGNPVPLSAATLAAVIAAALKASP